MISFDTNVLVRLLVADDARQLGPAMAILEEADAAGEPCHIADAVLCETAWVLASAYDATNADQIAAFSALVDDSRYGFEDRDAVREALASLERGKGDFSDYLIGVSSRRHGARTTYTFERVLRGHEAFTLIS